MIAKLRETVFSTLRVNCENKLHIFFKLCTKKKKKKSCFKRMITNLLCKVKTWILEYVFRKLVIFTLFNRKSLICQIFCHEDIVKSSLLKSLLAHNLQNWTESRGLSNSMSDLSWIAYSLGNFFFTVLKLRESKRIFPQF